MTSKTGYAEVIGDPIAHSKSPLIHGFWLEQTGMAFEYRATRITRADLPAYVQDRRDDPNWRGSNVTMPLKLDAAFLADDASDRAVAAGAANLLLPKDGVVLAGNTDVGGVLNLLAPRLERGSSGGITLLGNGGAARAALVALRMLNIEDVTIQARDLAAAYKLAVEFRLRQEPRPFDVPIESGGLINATPMGMRGVQPASVGIERMPADGWVFDMVTDPAETVLLRAARARGMATVDGLAMLIEQAAESFMLLFGQQAPRQLDGTLMTRLGA